MALLLWIAIPREHRDSINNNLPLPDHKSIVLFSTQDRIVVRKVSSHLPCPTELGVIFRETAATEQRNSASMLISEMKLFPKKKKKKGRVENEVKVAATFQSRSSST
jgi:hypothetical protein